MSIEGDRRRHKGTAAGGSWISRLAGTRGHLQYHYSSGSTAAVGSQGPKQVINRRRAGATHVHPKNKQLPQPHPFKSGGFNSQIVTISIPNHPFSIPVWSVTPKALQLWTLSKEPFVLWSKFTELLVSVLACLKILHLLRHNHLMIQSSGWIFFLIILTSLTLISSPCVQFSLKPALLWVKGPNQKGQMARCSFLLLNNVNMHPSLHYYLCK